MLNRKIVVVVGGRSALTTAVALECCAKQGAVLVLISAASKEAAETLQQLKSEKREASYYYCDINVEPDLRAIIGSVIQKYNRIDVLFHVADFVEENWERTSHLKAMMYVTKAVLPFMIKQRFGRMVIVFSSAACLPTRACVESTQYIACKTGVWSFVRAAALDLAQFGITVNGIESGLLATSANIPATDQRPEMYIPMGRLGRPEEVAAVAAFLASDNAAYVTGQWISATGGLGLVHASASSPGGSAGPSPHSTPPNGNGNGHNGNGHNGSGTCNGDSHGYGIVLGNTGNSGNGKGKDSHVFLAPAPPAHLHNGNGPRAPTPMLISPSQNSQDTPASGSISA